VETGYVDSEEITFDKNGVLLNFMRTDEYNPKYWRKDKLIPVVIQSLAEYDKKEKQLVAIWELREAMQSQIVSNEESQQAEEVLRLVVKNIDKILGRHNE